MDNEEKRDKWWWAWKKCERCNSLVHCHRIDQNKISLTCKKCGHFFVIEGTMGNRHLFDMSEPKEEDPRKDERNTNQ